jgi:RNA polymerase sigma-70 factor (ECF subfamily)
VKEETSNPNRSSSDETLVDRARAGELDAMDELVSRHHASVFRVAVGILRDEDQAADAAQEAFMKAFKGLKRFRGDASFKTWLLTITANEARGMLRKAGRRKEVGLDVVGPVPSADLSAQERVERAQDAGRIRELLIRLPEKQREAVTLRIFEDLTFREIGAIIGSSEGAARVNYHHGIRRLKEMLV